MRALEAKYSMSIVSRSPSVRSSSANGNSTVSSSLACPRTRNANCRTNAFHLRSAVSVASRCSIKPCSSSASALLATAKSWVFGVSYRGSACGFYVHRATHESAPRVVPPCSATDSLSGSSRRQGASCYARPLPTVYQILLRKGSSKSEPRS